MKKSKLMLVLFAAGLILGSYACKSSQQCDCPTFGHHASTKSGVYKTNSKNH